MIKLAVALLSSLLLTSCISYHHDGSNSYDASLRMERGVTSAEWVEEQLGRPLSTHMKEDGSEILHYHFTDEEETRFHFFIILDIHSKDIKTTDLYVEIEDGIVQDYWKERQWDYDI